MATSSRCVGGVFDSILASLYVSVVLWCWRCLVVIIQLGSVPGVPVVFVVLSLFRLHFGWRRGVSLVFRWCPRCSGVLLVMSQCLFPSDFLGFHHGNMLQFWQCRSMNIPLVKFHPHASSSFFDSHKSCQQFGPIQGASLRTMYLWGFPLEGLVGFFAVSNFLRCYSFPLNLLTFKTAVVGCPLTCYTFILNPACFA